MESETGSVSYHYGSLNEKIEAMDLGVCLKGPALMGKQLMILRPKPNQLTGMTELIQDRRFKLLMAIYTVDLSEALDILFSPWCPWFYVPGFANGSLSSTCPSSIALTQHSISASFPLPFFISLDEPTYHYIRWVPSVSALTKIYLLNFKAKHWMCLPGYP